MNNRRRDRRTRRRGMSLVEIMVVIALILTLSALLAYGVVSAWMGAQADMTMITLSNAGQRVEHYKLKYRKLPDMHEGLAVVYRGEAPPEDAWGTPLQLLVPGPNGAAFAVLSYGADGHEGGDGNDADLMWSPQQQAQN